MQNGGFIESVIESWNKHLRNFFSGDGCRARQKSVRCNIQDIFVRLLIASAFVIALVRRNLEGHYEGHILAESQFCRIAT